MVASSASTQSSDGRRTSQKRRAVREVVSQLDAFRSAQEIHHLLREQGASVGLSTVYRNLAALAEDDEVDTLRNEDGEVLYRKCSTKHHHHLVCRACGRVEEIEGPAVERWAQGAAAKHGFVDPSHTIEIFGLCPDCA